MGYEILLFLPVILLFFVLVMKNTESRGRKIVLLVLFVVVMAFYFVIWPQPVGIGKKGFYWKGKSESILEGILYLEERFKSLLKYLSDRL